MPTLFWTVQALLCKLPNLDDWPVITLQGGEQAKRINMDTVTKEEVASLKPGDTVPLSGKMLTGRDAAHKKMVDMLNKGKKLPVDLQAASFIT